MVVYKDECCGCSTEGYPCAGNTCPNKKVKHLFCDECNEDTEQLIIYAGRQLCLECLLKEFDKIFLED